MSLDTSGDAGITPRTVPILVTKDHPLIKLANALPWAFLIALVVEDLKRTTAKGCWWKERKLLVRVHLAAYILQKLYDLTDRQALSSRRRSFYAYAYDQSWQDTRLPCSSRRLYQEGKGRQENEFGRVFQLGRIKGNFLFVMTSTSLRMDDKHSFATMVTEHAALFGDDSLKSASADKGYWSARNQRELTTRGIQSGLQHPVNIKSPLGMPRPAVQERLRNRRAGIEPLIGHAKHGGQLGRSRMKSDAATLAAGYASVLGFNLRQISRAQRRAEAKAA